MNVIFPVGKSMIESFWPSLVRDFVGVMYCVEVEDLSPTVTFETTVRSSAAQGRAAAKAKSRARFRRRIMMGPPFWELLRGYHWRVEEYAGSKVKPRPAVVLAAAVGF